MGKLELGRNVEGLELGHTNVGRLPVLGLRNRKPRSRSAEINGHNVWPLVQMHFRRVFAIDILTSGHCRG